MTAGGTPRSRLVMLRGEVREHAWAPFPGMQRRAWDATEFEVLVGGAKGPGKSDIIIYKPLKWVMRPRFKALILRPSFPEVQELVDRTGRLFRRWGAHWTGSPLFRWTFPSGAIYQFGYCDTAEDVDRYQGQEWAYIGYDEFGNNRDASKTRQRLVAEIRCPDPTVPRQFVASANPGRAGHAFCKTHWVVPCGKDGSRIVAEQFTNPHNGETLNLTRRFIPGRVTDNPIYANDTLYMATLLSLPDVLKRQLLLGDWDAGFGLAMDELDETVHIVRPFVVPKHWTMFGSFDWGYAHWWVFGWYAVNEDGRVFKVNTIRGRRMKDWQIIDALKRRVPLDRLEYIVSGHDVTAHYEGRAQKETAESTEERFSDAGIELALANIARPAGLKNLREYTSWRERLPGGEDDEPGLVWMDTPGNRRSFTALQSVVVNPDDPEDALKTDADPETGEGGDDDYDETRYALASRPDRPKGTWSEQQLDAWSKEALEYERQQQIRSRKPRSGKGPLPEAVT